MRASGPSMRPRWRPRAAKAAADRQEAWRSSAAGAGRGPLPTDQVNLTDEDSRIMPVAGGGFEQCYNAAGGGGSGQPAGGGR